MKLERRLEHLYDSVSGFVRANTVVLAGHYTKPSFIVIGVQRAGTTALHTYLGFHPQLVPSVRKEVHFFNRHYDRGVRWYHSMFPRPDQLGAGQITFETTPAYIYEPNVAERIHEYNPNLKLILILRNPIERAYSAWNRLDWPRYGYTSFNDVVRDGLAKIEQEQQYYAPKGQPTYLQRGLYRMQIERYLALFPREQLLILENGEMRRDTPGTMRKITQYVGLSDYAWESENFAPEGQTVSSAPMNPETRERLVEFYRPYNQQLYELLGVDYGWK